MAEGNEPRPFSNEMVMYTDRESKTVYTIPMSKLFIHRTYGLALVSAWKVMFLLFYISNSPMIIKLAGIDSSTTNFNATVTTDDTNITITLNYTAWDGISILPF